MKAIEGQGMHGMYETYSLIILSGMESEKDTEVQSTLIDDHSSNYLSNNKNEYYYNLEFHLNLNKISFNLTGDYFHRTIILPNFYCWQF